MTVIPGKYVADAIDGYGKVFHTALFQGEKPPSEKAARLALRIVVRRKFTVRIRPATEHDLWDPEYCRNADGSKSLTPRPPTNKRKVT